MWGTHKEIQITYKHAKKDCHQDLRGRKPTMRHFPTYRTDEDEMPNTAQMWLDGHSFKIQTCAAFFFKLCFRFYIYSLVYTLFGPPPPLPPTQSSKESFIAGCQWLTPVILATQEAESRKIVVLKPAWANRSRDPISKIPNTCTNE
jgi:hypothetical protein